MQERIYDIILHAPLGERYGKMIITRTKNKISGVMELMNQKEPFSGTVDDDGNCSIEGKIVTLVKTIYYHGKGKIDLKKIHFDIQGKKDVYQLDGIISSDGKEKKE